MNTSNENYKAWDIDPRRFFDITDDKERIAFFLRIALLAPSSHNCQPWRFLVSGNHVTIRMDTSRDLPVSDPHKKHFFVAIGILLEYLRVVADYTGATLDMTQLGDGSFPDICSIRIVFDKKPNAGEHHQIFSIITRRSNRNPYIPALLPREMVAMLSDATEGEARVSLFDSVEDKKRIARILISFRTALFDDPKFRKELASFKRTNITRKKTGMPGFTMGFPTPLSLIVPTVIKFMNVMRFIAVKDTILITEQSPIVGFVTVATLARMPYVDAGRVLARIMLCADQNGYDTSVSAAPSLHGELREMLSGHHYPVMFFRAGKALSKPDHSPRYCAEDLITYI